MGKKRKIEAVVHNETPLDTSKPTATFKTGHGRAWTLSVAVPGSIITNAKSRELQASLAGQIARALAVFSVDEIVIFDDGQFKPQPENGSSKYHGKAEKDLKSAYTGFTNPNYFLARILSYLECPPYLRRDLFPMHPDLQHAGALPSLDMPHHLKKDQWRQYREGITLEHGRTAYTGLTQEVQLPRKLPSNTRVTVKFPETELDPEALPGDLKTEIVSPSAPREDLGLYWGYNVRLAESLTAVLEECPFASGYDFSIGTSERGTSLFEFYAAHAARAPAPHFNHFLLVFGGVAGLEAAVNADTKLKSMGVESPKKLFDGWINFLPNQGVARSGQRKPYGWVLWA